MNKSPFESYFYSKMSSGLQKHFHLFVSDGWCCELHCLGSQCLRMTEECYLNVSCYELYCLGPQCWGMNEDCYWNVSCYELYCLGPQCL